MAAIKIKVPKTPQRAYQPARPPGDLLRRQIEHLEWAVRPASQRSPDQLQITIPPTEAEAANRIGELTRRLHKVSAATPPGLAPQEPAATQARAAEKAKLGPSAPPKRKPKSVARKRRTRRKSGER